MIVHVWRRRGRRRFGAGGRRLRRPGDRRGGRAAGGTAVLTDPELPTGSDPHRRGRLPRSTRTASNDAVINVQGDLPTLDPVGDWALRSPDLPTPTSTSRRWARHSRRAALRDISVNKGRPPARRPIAPGAARSISRRRSCRGARGRITSISALRLSPRGAPNASSPCRAGCSKERERLEQLRALENGMTISVTLIDPAQARRSGRYPGGFGACPRAGRKGAAEMAKAAPPIAFQGAPGAYSDTSLLACFPERWKRCPAASSRMPSPRLRDG